MKILRSILLFALAQGSYGDSAEQARLHLLDVFTYAKYRFNLNSTVQISDAVEIIASATGSSFVSSLPSSQSYGDIQPSVTIPTDISKPSNYGLSGDCLNQLCLMMEYALTCKAIGLGFRKICAQYFLGAYYGCPIFPPSSAIYDAPSICLSELFGLISEVSSGELATVVAKYLNPSTFQTNSCGRRCYQNYQFASNNFYYSCGNQLATAHGYNFTSTLFIFQTFRNQACTYFEKNGSQYNCYSLLTSIVPAPAPTTPTTLKPTAAGTAAPTAAPPSPTAALLDFNCTYSLYPPSTLSTTSYSQQYGVYNSNAYAYNLKYSAYLCQQFSNLKCCAANDIVMAEQSIAQILPPCLYNYFSTNCTAVNLQNFCPLGAIANVTTVKASILLPSKPTTSALCTPKLSTLFNMYSQSQVLILQKTITNAIAQPPYAILKDDPYNFNPLIPFQVQILGFTYYNSTKSGLTTTLTPSNGSTYWPPQGDFELASAAKYVFQLVAQNLNPEQAANLTAALIGPTSNFAKFFQGILCLPTTPTVTVLNPADTTTPQPLVLPANSARRATLTSLMGAAVAVLVSTHFLLH